VLLIVRALTSDGLRVLAPRRARSGDWESWWRPHSVERLELPSGVDRTAVGVNKPRSRHIPTWISGAPSSCGAGPGRGPVIAKRDRDARADVERMAAAGATWCWWERRWPGNADPETSCAGADGVRRNGEGAVIQLRDCGIAELRNRRGQVVERGGFAARIPPSNAQSEIHNTAMGAFRDRPPRPESGRFGPYGGRLRPRALMAPWRSSDRVHEAASATRALDGAQRHYSRNYVGRPTPLPRRPRLGEQVGQGWWSPLNAART